MARLLTALVCLVTVGSLVPAAPVPRHLMPKEPPFAFPTQVGTKWVYERDGVDETIVISEVKDEKDGSKLVTTEYVGADRKRTPHQVKLISAAGVFKVGADGLKYDEPWCVLKLPHRPRQTWTFEYVGKDFLNVFTMTAGPVEKVKVPAGEFSARRVDMGGKLTRLNGDLIMNLSVPPHWYAHAVGLVRVGDYMKLTSFTPGKE